MPPQCGGFNFAFCLQSVNVSHETMTTEKQNIGKPGSEILTPKFFILYN